MDFCTEPSHLKNPMFDDNIYSKIEDNHYEDVKPKEPEHVYSKPALD